MKVLNKQVLIREDIYYLLKNFGNDSFSAGVTRLVMRNKGKLDFNSDSNSADRFIEDYLERGEPEDIITFKQVYYEYCEYCEYCKPRLPELTPVSRLSFRKSLDMFNFSVRKGGKNVVKIYSVTSTWI